jgi:enamine deaminase RidA (YjgF/YER057c/UK114 family)
LVCALQWAACQNPIKQLASYFEEPYPASSMVEVSALIDLRHLLMEVEAVAVIE